MLFIVVDIVTHAAHSNNTDKLVIYMHRKFIVQGTLTRLMFYHHSFSLSKQYVKYCLL